MIIKTIKSLKELIEITEDKPLNCWLFTSNNKKLIVYHDNHFIIINYKTGINQKMTQFDLKSETMILEALEQHQFFYEVNENKEMNKQCQ